MPETPPPIIRLRGLRKSYGNVQVLRGVDLDVPHGQTVRVIGPSGSGKSTLLRLLMLLDAPDAGELEIDGESPWTAEPGGRMRADNARLRRVRGKEGMQWTAQASSPVPAGDGEHQLVGDLLVDRHRRAGVHPDGHGTHFRESRCITSLEQ